jgi:hypothetical protein
LELPQNAFVDNLIDRFLSQGKCGLPESYDSTRAFASKLDTLAKLMRQSSHTVVLTGAGCSTAAGIPDFRGPNGIWTREMRERKKQAKSKKRKSDDTNTSDESDQDRSVDPTWVQCDLCQKVRVFVYYRILLLLLKTLIIILEQIRI